MNELGSIIKRARISKGYTMRELGSMCGLSRNAICKIESGLTKKVRFVNAKKLSKALDIPFEELMHLEYHIRKDRRFDAFTDNELKALYAGLNNIKWSEDEESGRETGALYKELESQLKGRLGTV